MAAIPPAASAARHNVRHFSADSFLDLGLQLKSNGSSDRWKNHQKTSKIEQFLSCYGVHPLALSHIWVSLQTTPFAGDRIDDSVKPEHLIVVYRWLKSYESEKELDATFHFGEKNIRRFCRELTHKVACLRKIKV